MTEDNVEFQQLYTNEFAAIALVAGAAAGSWAIGEEVAQEAFVRAHQRWSDIHDFDRPGAWIRRVAINLAIDRRRRLEREQDLLIDLDHNLVSTSHDPNGHIWEAVASLPASQRAAVALHYHDGYSTADIAEVLGTSVTAVTTNLYKARKRLAKLLGDSA